MSTSDNQSISHDLNKDDMSHQQTEATNKQPTKSIQYQPTRQLVMRPVGTPAHACKTQLSKTNFMMIFLVIFSICLCRIHGNSESKLLFLTAQRTVVL